LTSLSGREANCLSAQITLIFVRNQNHVFGVVVSKVDFAHGSSLSLQNAPRVGITFFSRMPEFRVANLLRDRKLLELAKQEAARFASRPDANLSEAERARVWARLKGAWQRRYGLVEAG
jgi:hypothetical protein